MAYHKSAEKRARQAEPRRLRNRAVTSRARSAVRRVRAAVAAGDGERARAELRDAERELRRAASKGVLPRRRADRSVSRLAKAVHRLSARRA
jgi:small subunit ribosomal protein S20